MIGADLAGLVLSGVVAVYAGLFLDRTDLVEPSLYWQFWPILGLFILAYATVGLYPGVATSPVDELRLISVSTSLVYLALQSITFFFREGEVFSRVVFILAWVLSLILVHVSRALCRSIFARRSWWGYPVIIFGAGKTGDMVIRTLQRRPRIGLKPVLVLDDNRDKRGYLHGVPVVGSLGRAPRLARIHQVPYAIIAIPGIRRDRLLDLIERYGQTFAHVLIIPDLFGLASLWVMAKDLGGILGLEVRQQLLLPGPRLAKFMIDLSLTLIGGTLILPILIIVAILIRLDSPGPIFYGQTRIGQKGQPFKAWKFRSMVENADQALNTYLEEHPDLKEAWEQDHKLKHDPRVTRVGRFLRRTSLDEL
ncbi:MAG: undecaprenyl-phosphate galactose phosphotransferase WbaP, partial [Merismopedia sp. SIO2A8]|nr:undecaprenyl-phosphate galactose phosphotransferase WbaP [Merismopedia sp. SIO2A8]